MLHHNTGGVDGESSPSKMPTQGGAGETFNMYLNSEDTFEEGCIVKKGRKPTVIPR
jgi:hypothetical protein